MTKAKRNHLLRYRPARYHYLFLGSRARNRSRCRPVDNHYWWLTKPTFQYYDADVYHQDHKEWGVYFTDNIYTNEEYKYVYQVLRRNMVFCDE